MRRSRTDRLFPPRPIGPRERQAAEIVRDRPGITVEQLGVVLGVTLGRTWQIVERLEARGYVQRENA